MSRTLSISRLGLRGDRTLWAIYALLLGVGLLVVYSSTSSLAFRSLTHAPEDYLWEHLRNAALGLGLAWVVHRVDYRWWDRLAKLLLVAAVLLLLYTLFFATKVSGAARWINMGGWNFQPSDLAKFALVVFLASFLARRQGPAIKSFRRTFLPVLGVVGAVCLLILPHNFSTAALLLVTSLVVLYIAGVRFLHLLGLFGAVLVAVTLLFAVAKPDRARVWEARAQEYWLTLTDPHHQVHPHVQEANIAIANGGLWGTGPGRSLQRHFLPSAHADYVYAIILEEYGLWGGVLVLALYLALLLRVLALMAVAKPFGATLAGGLGFLIVTQALVNMAVNVGLLPVTGLTLPLISKGGTSLLFTSLAFGVMLGISRRTAEVVVPAAAQPQSLGAGPATRRTRTTNARRQAPAAAAAQPQSNTLQPRTA